MGGEMVVSNNSCEIDKICETINTMIVVDDTTIAALLKKLKYKVVTAKNAKDAFCILLTEADTFDLVVTDVHMPEMNDFELHQVIAKEFDISAVFEFLLICVL
ncbi:hypothetical protein RND71_001978 [Anisodus tanguticus]|uniref:Response regulatory domain-containing protein n=1 Tax=Anisodus tanguticus TaxID=243964 RepID=A0AAE1T218_9SOLA|nr:hypothetical protein RND71_001978 [Anisodus tanguticus]